MTQHNESELIDVSYHHNIFSESDTINKSTLCRLFEKNSNHRSSKQSLYCFHEILSFHNDEYNREYFLNNPQVLQDITQHYLSKRAPDAMAYMKTHWERDHVHCHIMISSNNYMSQEVVRLSRSEFKAVKVDLEHFIKNHYPEIKESCVEHDPRDREKSKSNSSLSGIKQSLKTQLEPFFETLSFDDAIKEIAHNSYQVYTYRDVPNGIIHEGRKYRFTTLFNNDEQLVKKIRSQQKELRQSKNPNQGLEL